MNASDAQWVLDRLDRPHIEGAAQAALSAWDTADSGEGPAVFEVGLMPGDGTHYGLMFSVLGAGASVVTGPGGGTLDVAPRSASGCPFDGSYAVMAYLQRGRFVVVQRGGFVHPSSLEVLDTTPGSTLAICAFLNAMSTVPDWESNYVASLGD